MRKIDKRKKKMKNSFSFEMILQMIIKNEKTKKQKENESLSLLSLCSLFYNNFNLYTSNCHIWFVTVVHVVLILFTYCDYSKTIVVVLKLADISL